MHNILMVIRREYRERVQKKSFWIGTLVFPLLMVGLTVGPMALMLVSPDKQKTLAFVDATGQLAATFAKGLEKNKLKSGAPEYVVETVAPSSGGVEQAVTAIKPRVASGDLFAVVVAGPDLDAKSNYRFYARNVGDFETGSTVERALRDAVVETRFARSHLQVDRAALDKLLAPVDLESFQVSKEGGTSRKGFMEAYFGTFIFVFVLYMTLILYGVAVMRGILEEKSNRIIEVLLGSLTPQELMTGKILGIGLVGLTQLGIYALTAGALRLFVAPRFDRDLSAVFDAFTFEKMAYFLIFYLLGYFMYTALFAAVGAMCNSEQEAQNLQTPVIMCLVLPLVATIFFVRNPDSTVATVVSLIPVFTPMVMYMRISVLTPPPWEIALSIALMLATIWVLFRGVAKIFRIGILMYGKRPTIPEVLRWARN